MISTGCASPSTRSVVAAGCAWTARPPDSDAVSKTTMNSGKNLVCTGLAPSRNILREMRFAPEYVSNVLNDNFEDAKELLLTPLMSIHYAHLVMLVEQRIIDAADARAIREALN